MWAPGGWLGEEVGVVGTRSRCVFLGFGSLPEAGEISGRDTLT